MCHASDSLLRQGHFGPPRVRSLVQFVDLSDHDEIIHRMRWRPRSNLMFVVLLIAALFGAATGQAAAARSRIAGPWSGSIVIPGAPLRITVRFTEKDDQITGTIDIPQQNAVALPLVDISLEEDRLRFKISSVQGDPAFDGSVQSDVIAGNFTQNGQAFPFELKRGEPKKKRRPQDPKPPFAYMSEEVSVKNIGATLAGTLLKPANVEKPPVMVFITGSGPQNRDEEIFDHRPFWVLADFLARRGIASLRVDDRGVGKSTGLRDGMLMRDVASDTAACVEYLKARFEFGPIGLIGHSEGAEVAATLGAKRNDVAFIVMLAGPAVDGKTLMVEQNRMIFRAKGLSAQAANDVANKASALFDSIINNAPATELRARTKDLLVAQTAGSFPDHLLEAELDKQVSIMKHPAMKELLMHDPRKDLAKLTIPVLGLWGEKDVQVGAKLNHREASAVLAAARNPKTTLSIVLGVNHLFQTCETGDLSEYATIEETFSPNALSIFEEWLGKQSWSSAR